MKLNLFASRPLTKRPPLISFKEIAERFDLKPGQLRQAFANSKVPTPQVVFDNKASSVNASPKSKWYRLNEVLAWRQADLACRAALASSLS